MSDIVGEHEDIDSAFERPTLALLNRPDRQVMFAVLRLAFTRETGAVAAPVLHRRVGEYLGELAAIGIDVPLFDGQVDGKATCRRWLASDALKKDRDEDGQDFYVLSSDATEGIALINTMTRDRSGLSEHRVATIMAAVSTLNLRINPDVDERLRILDSEIDERQAERDRLLDGAELELADDDYVIDGFDNLLRLFGALPGDFRRVIDRMGEQRRAIISKFQSETGRVGDHLLDYLDMAQSLMTDTPEGRAFTGALDLLRDNPAQVKFRRNIEALLANPQSQALLRETERRDLKNLLVLMEQGFSSVLDARTAISSLLREQIVSHNADRDIAMGQALRSLEAAVSFSFEVGRAQDKIACDILPHGDHVEDMPSAFYDPSDDLPPEPLPVRKERSASPSAFAELMGQGGPSLIDLRRAIVRAADEAAVATGAVQPTLGDVFDTLPASLRRPVEVIGMLYLSGAIAKNHKRTAQPSQPNQPASPQFAELTDMGDLEGIAVPDNAAELGSDGTGRREQFRCVRPDGNEVVLVAPRVILDRGLIERLRAADQKIGATR